MDPHKFRESLLKIQKYGMKNPLASIQMIQKMETIELQPRQNIIIKIEHGKCLFKLTKNHEAMKIFKSIAHEAKQENFQEQSGEIYFSLAKIYEDQGNVSQAIKHFEKAITIFSQIGLYERSALVISNLAKMYYVKGKLTQSKQLLKRILHLTIPLEIEIDVRNSLARIHLEWGKITEALAQIQWCLFQSRHLKNENLECEVQKNYAEILKAIGEFVKARQTYEEALQSAIKKKNIRNHALIAASYAEFLIDTGDLDTADHLFREALDLHRNFHDPYQHVKVLNGYANLWLIKGFYDETLAYLHQSMEIISETGYKKPEIDTLLTFSEVYSMINQFDKAYSCLKDAEDLAWRLESDAGKARILIERGRINLYLLNLNEAELLLLNAHRFAQKANQLRLSLKVLILLANIYLLLFQSDRTKEDYFMLAQAKILEVQHLSKAKQLLPEYVNASIIHAMIQSIRGNYKEAEKILQATRKLAKEKGIKKQLNLIYDRLTVISQNLSQNKWNSSPKTSEVSLKATIDKIQEIIGPVPVSRLTLEDLDKIFLLSYKIDDIFGPTMMKSFNVNIENSRYKEAIDTAGSLYIVSLGYGDRYHQGLFGPFPFGTTQLNSLVYSKKLVDNSSSNDPTFVYFLLCFVYPKKISPYLYHRQKLETFFKEKLEKVTEISEITSELLGNLYMDVMDTFFKELLKDAV